MTKTEYKTFVTDLLAAQTPEILAQTSAFADAVEGHDRQCAVLVRKQHAATDELVAYLRARIMRNYDEKLYRAAYDAVFTALDESAAIDIEIQCSDLPGDHLAAMKTKLRAIFDRIYEDAYEAGFEDGFGSE